MNRMVNRTARLLAAATALVVAALAGCSSQSAGPLGPDYFNGQVDIVYMSIVVKPGQFGDSAAGFTSTVNRQARITGLSLVPVPGEPLPRLRHAVLTLVGGTARGWPINEPVIRKDGVPAIGALAPRSRSENIYFAATANTPGDYATAGVKITYRYHGATYSTIAWDAFALCVARDPGTKAVNQCYKFLTTVNNKVEKMAGLS